MARIRSIKPEFFMHEDLAELSPVHRLLFIGLWTLADREGRLEDRPRRIKAGLFPWDDLDVEGMLEDLAAGGFLVRYEADGMRCIAIPTFARHQRPHVREAASELPAPPESLPGCRRDASGRADHLGDAEHRSEHNQGSAKAMPEHHLGDGEHAGGGNGGGKGKDKPPPTPSAGAAGADGPASKPVAAAPAAPPDPKPPKRAKRTRPPSPDVEAVRSAVLELVGVEYPEAAWDQLRARLREGATRDDALEFVRWASAQPWEGGQLRLDPTVLFRRERFATGLAKARASAEGRMRLVGGLAPPPPEPEREAPRVGAVEVRRCAWCPQVMPHRWDGHGWIVAYHEGCGSPHATSMRARDVFDEIAATEAFAAAEAAQ